jgi:hypothetical protein
MQLHAMRSGSSGRHATQAAAIAQSQMEQLQRLRWTSLATTAGAFTAPVAVNHTVQADVDQVEMPTPSPGGSRTSSGWTRSIDVRELGRAMRPAHVVL